MTRLALAIWMVAQAAVATADPEAVDVIDVIDVIGTRREALTPERPGQSSIFRPEDPSRFSVDTLLSNEASATLPDTGAIKASGFAIPRIRGQDTRLTEVYIEDDLLQDPYSGLPVVDDLDVRAFGELQYHQGISPPDLETTNPVGALRYRERPFKKPTLLIGATYGKPFGLSQWALGATPSTTDGAAGKIFLRHHQTEGRYAYYNDHGTPYNASDDSMAMRRNNDRRSALVLPTFMLRDGPNTYRLLLLGSESQGGLPAPGTNNVETVDAARQRFSSRLASLKIRHATGSSSALAPTAVELRGSLRRDARTTDDAAQSVLGNKTHASLDVATRSLGVATFWARDPVAGRLTVGEERPEVRGDGGLAISRRARTLYGGAAIELGSFMTLELKYRGLLIDDERTSADNNPTFEQPIDGRHSTNTQGLSAALGWQSDNLSAYGQSGTSERPPSLLEEFGDGGRMRGNPSLANEEIVHHEVGVAWQSNDARQRVSVATFQDTVSERIIFLPAVADSMRAQNVERSRIRGVEGRVQTTIVATRLSLGITQLQPLDLTSSEYHQLPGIARHYASLGIVQPVTSATVRWGSRYQGQVFRDLNNSIALPAYLVHDLSIDYRASGNTSDIALGLAILNLANVHRLPVEAPGTAGNEGWSAYSEIEGYPLPGRQWRLSASLEL